MSANATTYDAVLKELWPQDEINRMTYQESAALALMKKDTSFSEKVRHVAFQYGNNQGRSADFATAQANAGSAQLGEFQVTVVQDYAVGIVDGLTLERTKSNRVALVDAVYNETRSALEELSNTLSFDLWNDGNGDRGNVGSISTVNLVLDDSNDITNFEVGMELVAAATETGALRSGSATITAIDYENYTITTDSNWTSQITSLTAGDFLFVEGDAPAGGSAKKISGIPAWIPYTAPGATAFFGLDRTTHLERMSGHRLDASTYGTIEEAAKTLLANIRNRGGKRAKPNKLFMNPIDMNRFDLELGDKRRYVSHKVDNVTLEGFSFKSGGGDVMVVEDRYVPKGYAWALDMRTWTFGSLDAAPRIIQHDGRKLDRQVSADGVEFRAKYVAQPYCDAPGWNGVVKLPGA